MASNTLKSLQQRFVNKLGAELLDKIVVVDRLYSAVLINLTCDTPGIDILLPRHRRFCRLV